VVTSALEFISANNLSDLVDEFCQEWMRTDNPDDVLRPITVVVPGPLVGQWFEHAVASRIDGDVGGAVAALDIIFPSTFLSRVLYGDSDSFGRFQAQGCALGLLNSANSSGRLSLSDALVRGRNLSDVVLLRPGLVDEYVADVRRNEEKFLLGALAEQGIEIPWRQATGSIVVPNTRSVVVFDCAEAHIGGLLPAVLRKISESVPVLVAHRRFAQNWVTGAEALGHWAEGEDRYFAVWEKYLMASPRDVTSSSPKVDDPQISLHGCVGAARQVEVARDIIVAALNEGIQPHEVRVVTLNAEVYAPLMKALWLRSDGAPGLQFEIADPSFPRPSERLEALSCLLDVMHSNFNRVDLVGLLSQPPITSKLGLTEAEADRLIALAVDDGVSLGLDEATRRNLHVYEPSDDGGTWSRFRDRLLAATIFESGFEDERAPLWPLGEADDLHAASAFSVLISRLLNWSGDVGTARSIEEWVRCVELWASIIGDREGVIDNGVEKTLQGLAKLQRHTSAHLSYEEFLQLFRSASASIGGSSTFGRGGVVVQDVYSLSSAPFALTCILGFDEQHLPSDSTNATLGVAQPQDPSSRARFRTSLLGLLSSTSVSVSILYDDRNLKSNRYIDRPISLFEVEAGCRQKRFDVHRRRHPRHPFSFEFATEENRDIPVQADTGASADVAFTFSGVASDLASALASRGFPAPEHDMPIAPKPSGEPIATEVVDVKAIESFIKAPQEAFLRTSFAGAYIPRNDAVEVLAPRLEIQKGLEAWSFRDELFRRHLESRGDATLSAHADGRLGSIAPGLRSFALSGVGGDAVEHLVSDILDGLEYLSAVINPELSRAAVFAVSNSDLSVKRPEAKVYDVGGELLVLDQTVSSTFTSRFWLFALQVAAVHVQANRPVTGIILGRPEEVDNKTVQGLQTPFLRLSWYSAEEALGFLRGMASFAAEQASQFPWFGAKTSLLLSETNTTLSGLLGLTSSVESAWSGDDFSSVPGEGESAAARLLLPFDLEELKEVANAVFVSSANRFGALFSDARIVKQLSPTKYVPWYEALAAQGESDV